MEQPKCTAVTIKTKTRCKRNATHAGHTFCYQHAPAAAVGVVAAEPPPPRLPNQVEIAAAPPQLSRAEAAQRLLRAHPPSDLNSARTIRRISARIVRGPRVKDTTGGAIYIYSLSTEPGMNYWKVGMTSRTADKRLKEWASQHREAKVIKHADYRVDKHVKYVESLIHLYLDHCRMYRYPLEKGSAKFRSYWKTTGELIDDKQVPGDRLVAKNKHTEWFYASLHEIKRVVEGLIRQA